MLFFDGTVSKVTSSKTKGSYVRVRTHKKMVFLTQLKFHCFKSVHSQKKLVRTCLKRIERELYLDIMET